MTISHKAFLTGKNVCIGSAGREWTKPDRKNHWEKPLPGQRNPKYYKSEPLSLAVRRRILHWTREYGETLALKTSRSLVYLLAQVTAADQRMLILSKTRYDIPFQLLRSPHMFLYRYRFLMNLAKARTTQNFTLWVRLFTLTLTTTLIQYNHQFFHTVHRMNQTQRHRILRVDHIQLP